MAKKGFTLIELLAVIVILAIIMVIVTPAITNVIEEAKKGSFKNSAHGIIKAAEQKHLSIKLKPNDNSESLVYEYVDGKLTGDEDFEFKGSKPKNGKIVVTKDGSIGLAITNGKWCITKDYYSKELVLKEYNENTCKVPTFYETITDKRDNKVYKIVKIENQVWMAENLKYTGNGCLSKIWDNNAPSDACQIHATDFGEEVLYQWDVAMNGSTEEGSQGICPDGWHLPTDAEWKILEGTVDSMYGIDHAEWNRTGVYRRLDAGKKIKSSIYWNGSDKYAFNALPAGTRAISGVLFHLGSRGNWWTSSPSSGNAWLREVDTANDGVYRDYLSKGIGLSVRCILGE